MRHAIDRRTRHAAAALLLAALVVAPPADAQSKSPRYVLALPQGVQLNCAAEFTTPGFESDATRYYFWIGDLDRPVREIVVEYNASARPLYYFDRFVEHDSAQGVMFAGATIRYASDGVPASGQYSRMKASDLVAMSARDSTERARFEQASSRALTSEELHFARQMAQFFYRVRCGRPSTPKGDSSQRRTSL